MALKYIFDAVASKIGIDPELNPEQASWLKEQINVAANRLYRSKDLPIQLKEVFCKITNEQTTILPGFVGEVRAMRSQQWNDVWTLNDIRPRYHTSDWPNQWNKARLIAEVPIGIEILNAAPITIEYPEIDESIIVTAVGETINSNRGIDNITIAATINTGTKSFTEITALRKNKPTTYNVTVKDSSGATISHIYADQTEARYLVMDVSKYPTIRDCSDGTFVMEVLYKPTLPKLINDEDAFPLIGYDDVLIKMTLQVIAEDEEGKEQRAILMDQHAKELREDIIQDKTGTTEKPMFMAPHGLYDLFPKWSEQDSAHHDC